MNKPFEEYSLEDLQKIDYKSLTSEEIDELRNESRKCYAYEQSIKLIINSIYGAFANEYFHFYNIAIAETVTLQGQDAIKFTEKMVEKYFHEFFHKDRPLLRELGVPDDFEVKPIKGAVWKYTDTDSFSYNSKIRTSEGEIQIGDLYEQELSKNGPSDTTEQGHESTTTDLKILNWVNNKVQFSSIKRLIRHKVTKPKWKITTATGKSIEMTEDHSAIVFRNGQKIAVKPSEINLETDKILEVYE
jgi:DNA polymerase elongation subunit (family B)